MRNLQRHQMRPFTARPAMLILGILALSCPPAAWSQPAGDSADAAAAEQNDSPRARHRQASQLFRAGKVIEARRLWDEAAAQDPNLPPSDIAVAFAYLEQGNLASARVAIDTAAGRVPDSPLLWIARAQLAAGERGLGTARDALHKAHDMAPGLYITNLWLGQFYEERGALSDATEYYKAAVAADSQRTEALTGIARLQFRTLDMDGAFRTLQRVSEIDPTVSAESRMAALHLNAGDLPGALMWQEQAVAQQPGNQDALVALARLQLRLKQFDSARATIERIPAWEDTPRLLLLHAQIDDDEGRSDEAAALYRKIIQLDPENVIALNNLAMILLESDQSRDEAVDAAARAIALAPGNPAVRATHACALQASGHKDAATALQRAVHEVPADPWVRFFYGRLLSDRKQHAQARTQLRACLLLDSEFPRKEEVDTLLETLPAG
ncbi:tetratricopeptide repeat protein [Maioricimonas sp. JC845]|uniref:tetratricopeptide repeat protein n=1 Tax=Maioricimonas sp. JC845 TaxID=3232138 RepID=UPI00345A78A7